MIRILFMKRQAREQETQARVRQAAGEHNVPVVELRHAAAPPPAPPPAAAAGLDQAHAVALGALQQQMDAQAQGIATAIQAATGSQVVAAQAASMLQELGGHWMRHGMVRQEVHQHHYHQQNVDARAVLQQQNVDARTSMQQNVDVNVDARQFLLHQQNQYNAYQTVLNELHATFGGDPQSADILEAARQGHIDP